MSCEPAATVPSQSDKLQAFVTIAPQAYFVERVGQERVDVHVLVAPGQSYHTFEPTPKQVKAISAARVYFGIGVPFEAAIRSRIKSVGDELLFVDTSEGIPRRPGVECAHDHEEGTEHHHHEDEGDPHIWLDPRLVKLQARRIEETLSRIDPDHADQFRRNLASFEQDLDAVHARLTESLKNCRGKEFFVFHPSFGYFGDAYGLTQVAIEESGKSPSARQVQRLVEKAKAAGVTKIFVQPQFADAGAEAVAREIGATLETIDALSRDYLTNLEDMAAKIRLAVESRSSR